MKRMERDHLRKTLGHLGIQAADYRVLKLLPLIYIAWADGKMEGVKKERLHAFAAVSYDLSAAGMAVLERWLTEPPSRAYVTEGLRDIYRLALAPDDIEVDFSELPALLSHCEGIARSTAHALDQPTSVTPLEELALKHIAAELHIDHGESWAELLRELDPERTPPVQTQAVGA